MRLTAASQQAAFEYDHAIKTYLDLYETTKKAKKLGIKPPEPLPGEKPLTLEQIGLDAVYNAAYAAEVSRDFKRAVDLYTPVPEGSSPTAASRIARSGRSPASTARAATSTT